MDAPSLASEYYLDDIPIELSRRFGDLNKMRLVNKSLLARTRDAFIKECFEERILHPELRSIFDNAKLPLQRVLIVVDSLGNFHLFQVTAEIVRWSSKRHPPILEPAGRVKYLEGYIGGELVEYHIDEYILARNGNNLEIFRDFTRPIHVTSNLRDLSLEIYETLYESDSKNLGFFDLDVKTIYEVVKGRNCGFTPEEIKLMMKSKIQSRSNEDMHFGLYVMSNLVVLGVMSIQDLIEIFASVPSTAENRSGRFGRRQSTLLDVEDRLYRFGQQEIAPPTLEKLGNYWIDDAQARHHNMFLRTYRDEEVTSIIIKRYFKSFMDAVENLY